jgi:hypothetical protein
MRKKYAPNNNYAHKHKGSCIRLPRAIWSPPITIRHTVTQLLALLRLGEKSLPPIIICHMDTQHRLLDYIVKGNTVSPIIIGHTVTQLFALLRLEEKSLHK